MGRYFRSKEEKLTYRFYEPLVLLEALGRAQGERVPLEELTADLVDTQDAVKARRALLDQLSIACDFKKGGMTTTALALEFKPSGPTYWVSSPEDTERRTVPFLQRTLELLAQVASSPSDENLKTRIRMQLFQYFAQSCKPRLIKTWSLLQRASIREEAQAESQAARDFLRDCRRQIRGSDTDLLAFCAWAYIARRSRHVRRSVTAVSPDDRSEYSVRHYLGRIASVYRAAEILTRIAPSYLELFEDVEIKAIPSGEARPGPPFDGLITLDGIARRMVPQKNDVEYDQLTEALASLDNTASISETIEDSWKNSNFKPRVHAEIELLDAVHRADIRFYGDDRYIACSKAACFCCYHYICHHPGKFVRPASHNNLYLSWRAPDLPQPKDEAEASIRRKLLNEMVAEFRIVAKDRILRRSGRRTSPHPDSTTGMTTTATTLPAALHDQEQSDYDVVWNSFQLLGLGAQQETEEDGGVPLSNASALAVA